MKMNEIINVLFKHDLHVEVDDLHCDYKLIKVYYKKPNIFRRLFYFKDDDFHIHTQKSAITIFYPNKKDRTRKFVKELAIELSTKLKLTVIVEDEVDNVLIYKDGKSRKLGEKFAN